jgi:hypothetical protein
MALRAIWQFMDQGDRPVYKLPFGLKCHEPFVILYSIHANLSDDVFVIVYLRQKNEFGQNPEENIYTKIGSRTIAPGQLPPLGQFTPTNCFQFYF